MAITNPTPKTIPAKTAVVYDRMFLTKFIVNGSDRTGDDSRQMVNISGVLKPSRVDGQSERVDPTDSGTPFAVNDLLGVIAGLYPDEYPEELRSAYATAFGALVTAVDLHVQQIIASE